MSEVANVSAALHVDGYQSRSLNSFRSAISSVCDKVGGMEVGKHPMVAIAHYRAIWDVQVVLQCIECLGPSTTLFLKLLTYELLMLLALTRPLCSADLASLHIHPGDSTS